MSAASQRHRAPSRRGPRPVGGAPAGGRAAKGGSFAELVASLRPEVDRRLDERLRGLLEQARRHAIDPTVEALRDLVARGGKRYRAGLAAAAFVGVRPRARLDPALDAGVALELLHAYLLVQDDWMDGDDTRRGGPSVHAALGRAYGSRTMGDASAILSSDFGWGLAVQALLEARAPAQRVLRALQAFTEAHRDVITGQQLDLLGQATDIEQMHALKTGSYTVRGPLLVGACLAGAGDDVLVSLRAFAEPLGVAYQIRDDLLGVFGSPAQTGKPLGGDLREGKRTVVTVAAQERLDTQARRAYRAVFANEQASDRALQRAAQELDRCGVRAQAQRRLEQLCRLARRRCQRLPLQPRGRAWLSDAVALVAAPTGGAA